MGLTREPIGPPGPDDELSDVDAESVPGPSRFRSTAASSRADVRRGRMRRRERGDEQVGQAGGGHGGHDGWTAPVSRARWRVLGGRHVCRWRREKQRGVRIG